MQLLAYSLEEGGVEKVNVGHTWDASPIPEHYLRHCHEGYELLYVVRGDGRYVIEGEEYILSPQSLLLIPPHSFHYIKVNYAKEYERYVINFQEDILPMEVKDCLNGMFADKEQYGRFYQGDNVPSCVSQAVAALSECTQMSEEFAKCYIVSFLSAVLLRLSLNEPQLKRLMSPSLGSRVVRYLNAHLTEDVSLDAVAKNFFVSKFHLCRAFKEYNGVSVLQYITEKRVMYARHLMDRGETAVNAASKAGFGDYSSFYRAHRRICGMAPRSNKNLPVSHHTYGMKGGPLD